MNTTTDSFPAAVQHHQAGRLADAEALYRATLQAEPNHAEAWQNLGVLMAQTSRPAVAVEYLQRAIALNPNWPAAHFNLGLAYQELGQEAEAAASYRRCLQLAPQHLGAINNLGNVLRAMGQLPAACETLTRAVALQPEHAESWYNLAVALQDAGEAEAAVQHYRQALRLKPDFAAAYDHLGLLLRGRDVREAIACFQQAIRFQPDLLPAYDHLGCAFYDAGRLEEAVASFERALRIASDHVETLINLGNVWVESGRIEEATTVFRRAVAVQPQHAAAHYALGIALMLAGHLKESIAVCERAMQLNPDHVEAIGAVCQLRLLHGDFVGGWPLYEHRLRSGSGQYARREFRQPAWAGESLAGRTILVHAEQGLGDTIHFLRYLSRLKPLAARTVFECQKPLRPLLSRFPEVDQLLARGEPLPAFDVQLPLLSLPRVFGTELGNIPRDVPYLTADPLLVEQWRERLRPIAGFRIGINWQGRQGRGSLLRQRDIPLPQFAPLLEVPGVRLISLQRGAGREELLAAQGRLAIADLGPDVDQDAGAFMDTAAIMMNLDLVITSDTAIPHLAGALGVPVWLALPLVPEWRWLLDRDDSPWYPTMRLFRQKERGRWEDVFQRIAAALRARLQERGSLSEAGRPSCLPSPTEERR